jgi:electron transport complex protein RnfB
VQAPLLAAVDAALPQTQCTRCGYPDCHAYAAAIAEDGVAINRCPPGGAQGVVRLSRLTGAPVLPLDASCGSEGPLRVAVIDESWCIGCTLCIKACPVDCIVGSAKRMHTIIESQCTGCELCVPVCPVDCIAMLPVHPGTDAPTGWDAWSPELARASRERYMQTQARRALRREALPAHADDTDAPASAAPSLPAPTADDTEAIRKRAAIEAAMARARARREAPRG